MRYFFDTEFIERGPLEPIRLISIGIVAEDGREFYYEQPHARLMIEKDFASYGDPWLRDNVLPHLTITKTGAPQLALDGGLAKNIEEFIRHDGVVRPEFWAYYADYDWVVFCQIFGRMIDLPRGWPMYCNDLKQFMNMLMVSRDALPADSAEEHHALADARWVRDAFTVVTASARDAYTGVLV